MCADSEAPDTNLKQSMPIKDSQQTITVICPKTHQNDSVISVTSVLHVIRVSMQLGEYSTLVS